MENEDSATENTDEQDLRILCTLSTRRRYILYTRAFQTDSPIFADNPLFLM